jgi:hypothetical protein
LRAKAATSYAAAAISGVENVPNHIRFVFRGSRISVTHFPDRLRMPWYIGCLLEEEEDEEDIVVGIYETLLQYF